MREDEIKNPSEDGGRLFEALLLMHLSTEIAEDVWSTSHLLSSLSLADLSILFCF